MNICEQLELLDQMDRPESFADRLRASFTFPLRSRSIDILQMNITRRCNLRCRHCHVQASSVRVEQMSGKDMEACLRAAVHPGIATIDVTGGSPEMHPHLEWLLRQAAAMQKRVLVRTNAAILLDKRYSRFLDVYAQTGVEVVVSLPSLHRERTDRMRGTGVFDGIVAALRALNALGYSQPDSGLVLDLVHNPVGAFLPGSQLSIEQEYRTQLRRNFGIEFNRLYCLTNCPVGRYLDFLKNSGNLEPYMDLLKQAFNATAVRNVMCRNTLSVGCDGRLFDCDFNQMLDLSVAAEAPVHIRDFNFEKLVRREIVVRSHCFSCTAGSGSSCQGALDG